MKAETVQAQLMPSGKVKFWAAFLNTCCFGIKSYVPHMNAVCDIKPNFILSVV